MSSVLLRIVLALFLLATVSQKSGGQLPKQWCVADEQTPDADLQAALDWACGKGGADCTEIQPNHSCYFPNTLRNHASYAFNSYWQKYKSKGGSCYFRAAAFVTEVDPSHGSCKFESLP